MTSEELHKLIHKLSKEEKRFVKLNASVYHNSESSFLVFFDAFEKQKKLNEQELIAEISGKIKISQFHVLRNKFASALIDVLTKKEMKGEVNEQTLADYNAAVFLFARGFFKQAFSYLEAAYQHAYTHEEFETALLCISKLRQFCYRKPGYSKLFNDMESVMKAENELLEKHRLFIRFNHLSIQLFSLFNKFQNTNQPEINQLFAEAPLCDLTLANSFKAQVQFYNLWATYLENTDAEQSLKYRMQLFSLYENNMAMASLHAGNYINSCNNVLIVLGRTGRFDQWNEWIEKMKNIPRSLKKKLRPNEEALAKKHFLSHSIDRFLLLEHYEEVMELYNTRTEMFAELELFFSKEQILPLLYGVACAAFMIKDYRSCVRTLQFISHENSTAFRRDLFVKSRMLLLLSMFESKEEDTLESVIRSTKRYFSINQEISEADSLIFKEISECFYAQREPDSKKLIIELKKIRSTESGKNDQIKLEYIRWLSNR